MPWIRSESGLPRHPKTLLLKKLLGVEIDTVIGRLHLLWWWCLEYAIDGDLSKKGGKVIEQSCQIPLKFLIKAGFIDSRPYRRIHGWWENQGSYLQSRFNKNPEKWQRIKHLYERGEGWVPNGSQDPKRMGEPNRTEQTYGRTDVTDVRTDVQKKESARSLAASPRSALKPEDEPMTGEDWAKMKEALKHE